MMQYGEAANGPALAAPVVKKMRVNYPEPRRKHKKRMKRKQARR